MILGIDFDRVLFRTDEFKEFLDKEIPSFLETYPQEGNYDPEKHAEKLDVDPEKIFEALNHSDEFVYSDVERLEELRDDFRLVIVSRGDPYFQEKKIVNSGVLEHVDGYFIVEDEDKDVVEIDFLVDDRKEEIERVDVPGLVLDRSKEGLDLFIEEALKLKASE